MRDFVLMQDAAESSRLGTVRYGNSAGDRLRVIGDRDGQVGQPKPGSPTSPGGARRVAERGGPAELVSNFPD